MIPTIDFSVLGVLGAIATFFSWLWGVLCRFWAFCQQKFILFWLGSRLFRSIAEIGLFAVWYSLLVLGISTLLNWLLGQSFSLVSSESMKDVWRVLNITLPIDSIFQLCVDLATMYISYLGAVTAFRAYRRIMGALTTLMGVGRV